MIRLEHKEALILAVSKYYNLEHTLSYGSQPVGSKGLTIRYLHSVDSYSGKIIVMK